jgi:capsid protein
MSNEVLTMKFNENYSASRAAIELVYRNVKRERMNLETDALNPIVGAWTAAEIAQGTMRARGWLNPTMRAAWLHNRWIGAPRIQIDPSKEAKANKDNLEMGVTTISRIAREENGSDAVENMKTNEKEIPMLTPVPWSPSAAVAGDGEGDENTEGSENG